MGQLSDAVYLGIILRGKLFCLCYSYCLSVSIMPSECNIFFFSNDGPLCLLGMLFIIGA